METDVITAALIRAVVTVYLIKQKEAIDNFYNKIVEDTRQNFDTTIKHLYSEGQKLEHELHITKDRLVKQDKELEQYFKVMPIHQHMANIEVGKNERPEYTTKQIVPTAQLISLDEDNIEQKEHSSKSDEKKRYHVMDKKEIDNDEMQ
ncbi:hypothetical protein C1646_775974 [Rhizophagus diaphanus]|nr:hypothetical protein C1646_775974 [Rhizophagus diaphanus] [Rhizophagus sp. MUCL 43196]